MTNALRVLQVHNKYRPGWGGEDTVAALEADLLRRNGHEVERLSAWTGELEGANALKMIGAGFGTVWSSRGYSATKGAISRFSPDILHVHNTFPLFSPSVFWAANNAGVRLAGRSVALPQFKSLTTAHGAKRPFIKTRCLS